MRSGRSRLGNLALAALLLLGVTGVAAAHRDQFPKRDLLLIERERLTLTVEYSVPTSDESAVLRQLFDRDHSGALDGPESQALLGHLQRLGTSFVKVELDGHPLALRLERSELSPLGDRTGTLLATFTLTAPLALGSGRHQLRLLDRHKDRRQAVPIRVGARGVVIATPLPPLPLVSEEQPLALSLLVE